GRQARGERTGWGVLSPWLRAGSRSPAGWSAVRIWVILISMPASMQRCIIAERRGQLAPARPCSATGAMPRRTRRPMGPAPPARGEAGAMLDLGTSFLASVARDPDALAIVDGDVRLTYSAWYERISALVAGFDALGLEAGDHLVTVLQNRWQAATIHWACQFAGIIVTPLNW